MKCIQFVIVSLLLYFSFAVLHINLVEDAESTVSVPPQQFQENVESETTGTDSSLETTAVVYAPSPAAIEEPAPHDSTVTITGVLDHGDTFDSALRRDNVPKEVRSLIIRSLSDTLDFRRLKPLDTYTVTLNGSGTLEYFRYHSGPLDSISITNSYEGYIVKKDPIELERQRIRLSGEIESSLLGSFTGKDENVSLIYAFSDIFASKIDFNTEVQKGDCYSIIVDKYYKNGNFVGYGKIQSATYTMTNGKQFTAIYYIPEEETFGSYFDQSGQAVGTSFLRSPLPFARVSSRFSYRRKHPVTGVVKPHLGIDLAAPKGTPIMAAADGTVLFVGRNNGNGKQVVLAHDGGYKTYYGHLSRFKKGLRRGAIIHKKDIIGYVGSTGIATGPHLDYRIKQGNTFKNPFSIEFSPKTVLSEAQLQDFFTIKESLSALEMAYRSDSETVVLQVSHLTLASSGQLTLL